MTTTDDLLLHHAVSAFLFREAALLDKRDFRAWLDLFEDDGIYWVPADARQTDMKGHVSIMLEDKPLLDLRVTRLGHPHAYSVEPYPETTHLVANVLVRRDEDAIVAHSKLMVDELRDGRSARWSGSVLHRLRPRGDSFGIVLKRVDLIQTGGILAPVTIPF